MNPKNRAVNVKMIVFLWMLATATCALAGEITVTGQGRVSLPPEKMKITFDVSASANDMAEAEKIFSERTTTLSAALANVGVSSNEVVTAGLEVSPNMEYDKGEVVFRGYLFRESYTFTAKLDRVRLGEILAALFSSKAVERANTFFELFDPDEPRREARIIAVKNAREIAEDIADAAGVSLGEIEEIIYGDTQTARSNMRFTNFAASVADEAGASLRNIEISESVVIKWKTNSQTSQPLKPY